jgi:DNA-binding NtrC family response regulator
LATGKSKKNAVLVANGDNHLRKQLSTILDGMGYNDVVTGNGEYALDLFLKNHSTSSSRR